MEKGIVCALLAWRKGSLKKKIFCQNWEKIREKKYVANYNRKIFQGNVFIPKILEFI